MDLQGVGESGWTKKEGVTNWVRGVERSMDLQGVGELGWTEKRESQIGCGVRRGLLEAQM